MAIPNIIDEITNTHSFLLILKIPVINVEVNRNSTTITTCPISSPILNAKRGVKMDCSFPNKEVR
jgi:hypothetical protein